MNKTKRVAWHKHLKRARQEKEKARLHAHSHAPDRAAAARGATGAPGVRARTTTASRPARSSATSTRQTTPRP
jgi:hypothetical protein